MKLKLSSIVVGAALSVFVAVPTYAVDFAYFQKQSCDELGKESDALAKADSAIADGKKKKSSEAAIKNTVGFLLSIPRVRKPFLKHHGDLLKADFWRERQARIRAGLLEDFYPYPLAARFVNRYPQPTKT